VIAGSKIAVVVEGVAVLLVAVVLVAAIVSAGLAEGAQVSDNGVTTIDNVNAPS
jgi:hypothetical protein